MLSQTHHFAAASSAFHFRRCQEMNAAGFEKKGADQVEFGFDQVRNGFDDFSVDDLLDFPENNEFEAELVVSDGGVIEESEACVSMKFDDVNGDGVFGSFSPSEISVPTDDVAELEWLSHFVEDSFTEYSLAYPGMNFTEKTKLEPAASYANRLFPKPLTKPRAKRSRSSGKSWTLSASVSASLTDTTSSSSSSGSTSSSKPPPAKRQNRRLDSVAPQGARRCSHCGVQKTPQWRAGPEGAKTLCNACGVRFKSGRLCPEYRPACSPTFSSELHSNQHRKVVEMRRKKEVVMTETAVQSL
ncbi:hypothetical protein QQ045_006927 [Rhodiola kirilowii]